MYKWQQVKALRQQGVSIKKIARQLKLSKNTVRKHLRNNEPPEFKARQYNRLLEQYEGKIKRIPHVEPAILYQREIRRVSNDGYISWDGALYPVAMKYCLHQVRVEAEFGKTIKVYEMGGCLIAEHKARLFNKDIRPVHPEHEDMNTAYAEKKQAHRALSVRKFIETFKQTGQAYAEGLRASVTANLYWHIEEIMKYTEVYSISDVTAVLAECMEIGAYHKNSVKRLLEYREPQREPLKILNETYIPATVNIRRPLSDYKVEVTL